MSLIDQLFAVYFKLYVFVDTPLTNEINKMEKNDTEKNSPKMSKFSL
jgi:hypothetical protein